MSIGPKDMICPSCGQTAAFGEAFRAFADTVRGEAYERGMSLTAKQLRDVAWTLDHLSRLATHLLDPIAHGYAMNAGTITLTINLTDGSEPLGPESAAKILEWVKGTGMQDSLREAADKIERDTTQTYEEEG